MLKTSPVLTSSGGASPAFHHVRPSAPSPHAPARKPDVLLARSPSRPAPSPLHPVKHPDPPRSKPSALDENADRPALSSETSAQPSLPPPPAHPVVSSAPSSSHGPVPHPAVDPASTSTASDASPNKRRVSSATPAEPAQPAAPAQSDQAQDDAAPSTSKRSRGGDGRARILPSQYELCAVDDLVELIAHMVAELITTNDAIRTASGGLTRFHSRTAPGISVRDYLHRIARHATLTPPLLLAMVYYIDRLCSYYPDFTINTLTVHRFLITAATVAAKGLSDAFWNNTTYARVGGVRVAELKMLELEFLYRVDWRIVPSPEVLDAYYQGLVERTPGYDLDQESPSEDGLGGGDDNDDDDDDGSGADD